MDRVGPVPIIPDVEVLFVFHQQHFAKLFFLVQNRFVQLIELEHQPLAIAPQSIGFWVVLNNFGD